MFDIMYRNCEDGILQPNQRNSSYPLSMKIIRWPPVSSVTYLWNLLFSNKVIQFCDIFKSAVRLICDSDLNTYIWRCKVSSIILHAVVY